MGRFTVLIDGLVKKNGSHCYSLGEYRLCRVYFHGWNGSMETQENRFRFIASDGYGVKMEEVFLGFLIESLSQYSDSGAKHVQNKRAL